MDWRRAGMSLDLVEFFRSTKFISIRSLSIKTAIYFTHNADNSDSDSSSSSWNNNNRTHLYRGKCLFFVGPPAAAVVRCLSGDTFERQQMAHTETNKSIKLTSVRYPIFSPRPPRTFFHFLERQANRFITPARTCVQACTNQFPPSSQCKEWQFNTLGLALTGAVRQMLE